MIIIPQYNLTTIIAALDWNDDLDTYPANPLEPIFLEFPIIKLHEEFLGYRRAIWIKPKTDADSGSELDDSVYSQNEVFVVQIISHDFDDCQAILRFLFDSAYEFNEKADYTIYTNLEAQDAENEQDSGKYWSKFKMLCGLRRLV